MSPIQSRPVSLAAVVLAVTIVSASQPLSNRPWPPRVQKPIDAPVLPPSEALSSFSLPPGYSLEVVASEPLVQDPIVMDWDADGRLWVVELPGYMRDITASGEYDPLGRIVVLEDVNQDGRMDRRRVYADGLIQPRSLKVLDGAVLVGEPPNIWLLPDANGDLRADGKQLVTAGYGRRETNVEVNANGLLWALDNRVYVAGTGADLHLRWRAGKFETQTSLSRGQWGLTQDDAGRIYRNHNESVLHVDLVPTPYLARNPNLLRTRGSHETVVDPQGDINIVWPSRATPGTNRAYQHGILRDDGTLAAFTAACAPTVYRGDRLPIELRGNVFVAEPAANLVSRLILYDDGTTLRGRKAYGRTEFVTSTDERFRPVYLSNAPDGTLYIVDMYRGIIQHRAYITQYLRDQIVARKLEQPIGLGRIYRVVHETTQRDVAPTLSAASPMQLAKTLTHPNGWWRDTAQQLLVQRHGALQGDGKAAKNAMQAAVQHLRQFADVKHEWQTRVHALWTLDGIDAAQPLLVIKALRDQSRELRLSALRLAERWLGDPDHALRAAVLELQDDKDWNVRLQLAASAGALPAGIREQTLAVLLQRHGNDPVIIDVALSSARGAESTLLDTLLESAETPQRDAAVTMLVATLVRSGQESVVQEVFARAADANRPPRQRSALLRGAEVALVGAAMPGSLPPRRSSLAPTEAPVPCPTCPGGRAGPGGAYAFRTEQDVAANNAATRGGRGRSGLRLNREPVPLTAWAARRDDFTSRVTEVLERITWPGKAGDAAPLPPLSGEEQQRFDAGREVYRNICQACHQPDGRGQERLAPTLLESPLTVAAAEIPIRLLLHGKEGAVGLMPPVGSVLSDDQIAAVLTYVRREWGQAGTPVDPAEVASVRRLTAGRSRPWAHEELMKMVEELRGPARK